MSRLRVRALLPAFVLLCFVVVFVKAQSDNSFSSYESMSSAATRDAAAMNSASSKSRAAPSPSSPPGIAASNPAQDAAFVRGAIANALPQLLVPGAKGADVSVRAEVPGVVERPEAVPGKPLATSSGAPRADAADPEASTAETKKDGIFYQDIEVPSNAPLILANQDGDPRGPRPPPPKPASASIATENAVAETAKRTAGDASADVVRAKGLSTLPVLTEEKESKLEAAFDRLLDKLASPKTDEIVQRGARGALNGVLAAAGSTGGGSGDDVTSSSPLAAVAGGGGQLPAGNEADATSPGGIGGNAGFLGIPLSDVKRVAGSGSAAAAKGNTRRSLSHLGGREPDPESPSSSSSPPGPPLPDVRQQTSVAVTAKSAVAVGHDPPGDHRPPAALASVEERDDDGRDDDAPSALEAEEAVVAEAPAASRDPSPAQKDLFVSPKSAFAAAASPSPPPEQQQRSRPPLQARSATDVDAIDHRPPNGHNPPIGHNPPLSRSVQGTVADPMDHLPPLEGVNV